MPSNVNRRAFLKRAGGAAAVVAAPGIIRSASAAGQQLVFAGFGGDYQTGQTKAFFEPFEQETGIKIVQTTGVDLANVTLSVYAKNLANDQRIIQRVAIELLEDAYVPRPRTIGIQFKVAL